MATIKAIEDRSVHQIQSGQVIVDLISVVKELVENSLDAGGTSIDIRFKNHGLDSVEVQDNGNGIAPDDFESIALKHHTSKLSSFEDLDSLDTFGFRGEALSSLSALAALHIVTARAQDGAVGKRLDFETSGRLKSTSVVAAQKGTTVFVEDLFHNLPVRRKELERNIKREYGKVLNFLQSYACIGVGVRLSVSNQMPKGKKLLLFSTKGNATTKENIVNVFGAKTLISLVRVDMRLEMQPGIDPTTQPARNWTTQADDKARIVYVEGHVSRPGWGEGRQSPDRQMFFVNSRPCMLPQVTKVFNEVYRAFNHHQSPFILANFRMDTSSYDVNVSPDKNTVMLHDQTALLEALKAELTMLFETIDHTLPQTQLPAKNLPAYKPLAVPERGSEAVNNPRESIISDWASRDAVDRHRPNNKLEKVEWTHNNSVKKPSRANDDEDPAEDSSSQDEDNQQGVLATLEENFSDKEEPTVHEDIVAVLGQTDYQSHALSSEDTQVLTPICRQIPAVLTSTVKPTNGSVPNAIARMRSRRLSSESVDITVGETSAPVAQISKTWNKRRKTNIIKRGLPVTASQPSSWIAKNLTDFAAPDSQLSLVAHQKSEDGREDLSNVSSEEMSGLVHGDGTPEIMTPSEASDNEGISFMLSHEQPPLDQQGVPFTVDHITAEENAKKQQDDEKVARLVHAAEHSMPRSSMLSRGLLTSQIANNRREVTYNLAINMETSAGALAQEADYIVPRRCQTASKLTAAREETSDETLDAESRLTLTVNKADFMHMRVIGQFNLGFILALRPASRPDRQDELFIIDQHAADEKYNYERLQSTIILQSQPMVRPLDLELSAVDKEVILTHSDAIQANGFEIDVVEDSETTTQTFQLLALPTTYHKTFQLSDLEELLHLLSDLPADSNEIPRPRKVQRMLAMRACRSSIMIGKTLTDRQMISVVRHMAGMEKPWNCPHGRPTMRHLYNLRGWHDWNEYDNHYCHHNDSSFDDSNELQLMKRYMEEQAQ